MCENFHIGIDKSTDRIVKTKDVDGNERGMGRLAVARLFSSILFNKTHKKYNSEIWKGTAHLK